MWLAFLGIVLQMVIGTGPASGNSALTHDEKMMRPSPTAPGN
ncbi:MAG: hypothetical protein ACRDZQ_15745 [Acidimicrobiales bacterium]